MTNAGKLNKYTCEKCGGTFTTIDLNDGVTPFMTRCRAETDRFERCAGMAQSHFYRVHGEAWPEWGWYTPDAAWLERQDDGMKDHVSRGGLVLRRLDPVEQQKYGKPSVRRPL